MFTKVVCCYNLHSFNHNNSTQHCNNYIIYVNNLGSQNVLEVNEPVLIVRSDDGQIGPKHVALYVLLMVIIDVLDGNINNVFKHSDAEKFILTSM